MSHREMGWDDFADVGRAPPESPEPSAAPEERETEGDDVIRSLHEQIDRARAEADEAKGYPVTSAYHAGRANGLGEACSTLRSRSDAQVWRDTKGVTFHHQPAHEVLDGSKLPGEVVEQAIAFLQGPPEPMMGIHARQAVDIIITTLRSRSAASLETQLATEREMHAAWRKRAEEAEGALGKTGGRPFTVEEMAAFNDFRQAMQEEVIPEGVEYQRRQATLSQEARDWTVGARSDAQAEPVGAAPEERETTCDGSGPFSFAGRLGPFVNVPLAFMEALTSGGDDLVREETIRALLDELRAVLSDAPCEPVGFVVVEHEGAFLRPITMDPNIYSTVEGAQRSADLWNRHVANDGTYTYTVRALVPAPTGREP